MALNDFHKVRRRKRHISNNPSQTAKKSSKPVPASTSLKLLPKEIITCNFFTPPKYTDMNSKSIGAENT
jgi:hypothetical protein